MKAKKILLTFLMVWLASLYAVAQAELKLIVTAPNFQSFIAGDLTAFKGTDLTKSFTVRNTGNASFTGVISYTDAYGSALSLQDVVVTYENGAIPAGTSFSWKATGNAILKGTLTSGTVYELVVTNLPISVGANKGLIFMRKVRVTDCIDDIAKGRSTVDLKVCDSKGANCSEMVDAWQSGTTRLIQRISKAKSEFIDVVDVDVKSHDFCAYNPKNPTPASGFRKVSYFTKMHTPTSGETVKDFYLSVSSGGAEEVPLSSVKIYKAIYNTTTKQYVSTGSPLAITAVPHPKFGGAVKRSVTRCFSDAISGAYFPLGNITGKDAYYIEFKVYNCQPTIDLKNFTTASYDGWSTSWIGKDDCDAELSSAGKITAKNTTNNPLTSQDEANTTFYFNHTICGACYGDYVDNAATYVERVSTLQSNETANCRIDNLFVNNFYAFLGTSYSDGVNYQANRAKLVVVLKLEGGLNYYVGSGAGGYYPHLQFRSPDGKHWNPINILGSAVGYNIPTDEKPKYDYKKIKMFEFRMQDLYALYPKLAQSNFDEKSQILYDYINKADIAYSLTGNCSDPNKEERPNYSVEMYLVADASCDNPLVMPSFKITRDANIMCPGCQFPGGAGRYAKMKRLNYGQVDNNDNGLADNGAFLLGTTVDALNADNNPDNNIRTRFGIFGDRVQMNTKYYLTSSESCNGITFDDRMIGDLKYSYLRMSFPNDTFKIDVTKPLKVVISSAGTSYMFSVPAAVMMTKSNTANVLMEINVNTFNAYAIAGSPKLPANFRFKSFDEIEIEFFMDIQFNTNTKDAYDEISFQNMPYFSSTPVAQYLRDFPQFECDPKLGPVVKDSAGKVVEFIPKPPFTTAFYKNTWLNCEGYEAIFNLVAVQQDYWYGDGFGSYAEDKSCGKGRLLSFFSSIGNYNFPKLFANEFRPAPMIESVDVLTPEGYKFIKIDRGISDPGKTAPQFYTGGSYSGVGVTNAPSTTAVVGGINYTLSHLTIPNIYTPITDIDAINGTNQNAMRQVDEHLLDYVWVTNEAICDQIPAGRNYTPQQNTDTSALGKQYRFKAFFDLDPISRYDVMRSENPGNALETPVNQLTSTLSSTGIVAVTTSKFNLDFSLNNGSKGSPAKFPFVTITYDQTIFSSVLVNSLLPKEVTEVHQEINGDFVSILYQIDPQNTNLANTINLERSVALSIKGSLAQCFNDPNNPATFQVGFGWDCNAWPTDLDNLNNLCYYSTEDIKAYSIASGILGNVTAKSVDESCINPKIHYTHTLTSTGSEVNKVKYDIDFPDGLTLDTSSIVIKYGTKVLAKPLDFGITNKSTPLNSEWYALSLNDTVFKVAPFAGAVVQGARNEFITVEFDVKVASGCDIYVATSKTSFKTSGFAFCGNELNANDSITPAYKICPDVFTVRIKGGSVICGNDNMSKPILLNAIVPDSLGNCFTKPLTYEWTQVPSSVVLGTTDSLVVQPTVNTTYQVTVHDANGRIGIAQHTIKIGYEYEIGNVSWVCGSANKNICIPINATVPVRNGIIGMDFTLRYDKRYLAPVTTVNASNLGKVVLSKNFPGTYAISVITNPTVETDPNIAYANISIYYTSNLAKPNVPQFADSGLVICLPFTVVGNPGSGTSIDLTMREMTESYTYFERPVCWNKGSFKVTGTGTFAGALEYYQPYSKSAGTLNYAGLYHYNAVPTGARNIITVLDSCGGKVLGQYSGTGGSNNFNIPLGSLKNVVKITRDINNNVTLGASTSNGLLNFVNARDTRAMEFITTLNTTSCVDQLLMSSCPNVFVPSATQMIAADVNMSDSVRANDITQLQRRLVNEIKEFKQVQNTKGLPSLDYRFIDPTIVASNADFTLSSKFPFSDGKIHYWRDNVPNVPECLSVEEQCANTPKKVFRGILLGDVVNYTSNYYVSNAYLKTQEANKVLSPFTFNINLQKAEKLNATDYKIAVSYVTPDSAKAFGFDLGLEYNPDSVKIVDMQEDVAIASGGRFVWNDDAENNYIRSTNYTPEEWSTNGVCYYIIVRKFTGGSLTNADLKTGYGMINGDWANVEILGSSATGTTKTTNDNGFKFGIQPNPMKDNSIVEYCFSANDVQNKIEITNVLGQKVAVYNNLITKGQINLSRNSLSQGVYLCTIYDAVSNHSETIKFVVE